VRDWEKAEAEKGPYTASIVAGAQAGILWDLVGMKPVPTAKTADGRVKLDLSMERFGGALVAWLPADPRKGKFVVDAPRKAAAGTPMVAKARLMVAGKPLPGAYAVAFRLQDPTGNESVVSGVRQMRNGVAEFAWTPAVNDPPGTWTLTAIEQISGKQDRLTIKVSR
jgi:hypothetical protein